MRQGERGIPWNRTTRTSLFTFTGARDETHRPEHPRATDIRDCVRQSCKGDAKGQESPDQVGITRSQVAGRIAFFPDRRGIFQRFLNNGGICRLQRPGRHGRRRVPRRIGATPGVSERTTSREKRAQGPLYGVRGMGNAAEGHSGAASRSGIAFPTHPTPLDRVDERAALSYSLAERRNQAEHSAPLEEIAPRRKEEHP